MQPRMHVEVIILLSLIEIQFQPDRYWVLAWPTFSPNFIEIHVPYRLPIGSRLWIRAPYYNETIVLERERVKKVLTSATSNARGSHASLKLDKVTQNLENILCLRSHTTLHPIF